LKIRLDELVVARGMATTLKQARAMIGAGEVFVTATLADKIGSTFPHEAILKVKDKCDYVSRGGVKLEKALNHFQCSPAGWVCADIGASTGGFTDCLLQHGADRVYAIDVGYGQFSWKLRQDSRVIVRERFNARHLSHETLPEPIDMAVVDVSFISLTKVLPAVLTLFAAPKDIIALIKPQFELPRSTVKEGSGVVRDEKLHGRAIESVLAFAQTIGLTGHGVVTSPLRGPKGNKEFLVRLRSTD